MKQVPNKIAPRRWIRDLSYKIQVDPPSFWLRRPLALLAVVRKALSVLSPVPDLSIPDVPHGLCFLDGPAHCALHRPLCHPEAPRVPNRAVCPRRRAAVAPEEIGHAHD